MEKEKIQPAPGLIIACVIVTTVGTVAIELQPLRGILIREFKGPSIKIILSLLTDSFSGDCRIGMTTFNLLLVSYSGLPMIIPRSPIIMIF